MSTYMRVVQGQTSYDTNVHPETYLNNAATGWNLNEYHAWVLKLSKVRVVATIHTGN